MFKTTRDATNLSSSYMVTPKTSPSPNMDWIRGPVIGRGSSATVSLATSPSGGLFAAKSACLSESEPLKREHAILSTLSSPYLVAYKGFEISMEFNSELFYNLLMEYIPGGTLADVAGKIDEPTIGFYTWRILMGLEYLHSMGIVHCDVKPRNILIGADGPKIADLGCSRSAPAQAAIAGTPMYMAPEAARGEEQGFAADVWSLGCTVAELATGAPPWKGGSDDPVAALYRIGSSSKSPEIPGWLSEEGRDFLGKCLRRDPEERWTVRELLRHPYVKQYSAGAGDGGLGRTGEFELSKSKKWVFCSPTSTLEQGIWNSLQSSSPTSSSTSKLEDRISKLTVLPGEPRWELEEDWITVRS